MLKVVPLSNRRSAPLRPRSGGKLLARQRSSFTISPLPDGGFSASGSTVLWLFDPESRNRVWLSDTPVRIPAPKRDEGSVESGETNPSEPHPMDGDGGVESVGDGSGETHPADPVPNI